jgi:uncharacterized protein DUF262/uncharacterized protein DUF1524
MKADTTDLNHLFWTGVRYEVPMFQRPYVWTEEAQWEPLWEDISTIAERLLQESAKATPEEKEQGIPARNTPPHFLGAVVLDQMLSPPGEIERRNIVDGQQRLTTLQLLLAACRDISADLASKEAGRFSRLTENDSLLCKMPDDLFKVWPTNADRAAFRLAMQGTAPAPKEEVAARILEAHVYFKKVAADWVNGDSFASTDDRLNALRVVLWSHVKLVSINLEYADDAQVIFESLNARGTPLLAGDLIKNYLFQKASRQNANIDTLYDRYWRPLDDAYWRTTIRQGRLQRPRLDVFLFHWLTMRSGHDVLVGRLFESFKETIDSEEPVEKTLDDLSLYANVFLSFEQYPQNSPEEVFFYRLEITQTATATPLLLYLFSLPPSQLSIEQRRKAIAAMESWLVRRMLCRATTKNYNIVFAQLLTQVRRATSEGGDVVEDFLSNQQGESQWWPSDDQVRSAVLDLPLYRLLSPGRMRMVLEALESKMRVLGYAEEASPPRGLSIEHVMPQAWATHWPPPEGVERELATIERDRLVHTLGNLTLVMPKLNSMQSNAPWEKKRVTLDKHTVLSINKDLLAAHSDVWDEMSIRARGEELTGLILQIWKPPKPVSATPLPPPEPSSEAVGAPAITADSAVGDEPAIALRADVLAFLEARIPDAKRRSQVLHFLNEVMKLPDVTASVGRSSQTKDGWAYSVILRRKGSGSAFMHLYANRRALYRLVEEDTGGVEPVEFTNKKPEAKYRVRSSIATAEGFAASVELARRAYEKALP